MQVLIPCPDHDASAEVLTDEHLEHARQQAHLVLVGLLEATEIGDPVTYNDPALRAWRGHEGYLAALGTSYCVEWMIRGNTCELLRSFAELRAAADNEDPPEWWGGPVHDSHKSHLLRKQPSHYREHWPDLSDEIAVIHPGPENEVFTKNREVIRLQKAAERAQEAAARARQAADDAARRATQDARATVAQAKQKEKSNNGWNA